MTLLRATNLTKTFGSEETRVLAVDDATIAVEAGEVVMVLGPSGSGKTTLISMLGGLLTPTQGSVIVEGVGAPSSPGAGDARLRSIGFVFQSFNLLGSLSAIENVALPLRLLGVRRAPALERARELVSGLGLEGRQNARPTTLSGGEKQRVSLARALVTRPRVILADEPTASLDTRTGRDAMELLRRSVLEGGQACIVVTHDTRLVDLADRVVHIEDGRLTS